jgi:hypothetical protein
LWIVAAVMLIVGWVYMIHFFLNGHRGERFPTWMFISKWPWAIEFISFECFPSDDTCHFELIFRFTVAIVLLFRGYNANDHCSWCHYMSCVPTKKWKCNSSPTTCNVR